VSQSSYCAAMNRDDRAAKLRRMAEHPTSNPHEAALAREELARMGAPLADPMGASTVDEFIRRATAIRLRERDEYRAEMDRARVALGLRPILWEIEQAPMVVAIARRLKAGDRARTWHDFSPLIYDGPVLRSEVLTVERVTPSGVMAMSDGSRFNARGYKVGETGRDGHRTFIVKEP
jgi:hypothetical protein